MKIWQDVKDVIAAPFGGDVDAKHLFLLIGMLLIFISAWLFILSHIRAAMMEVID